MKNILLLITALVILPFSLLADNLWQDVDAGSITVKGERYMAPVSFRTVLLNKGELTRILSSAPHEKDVKVRYSNAIFTMPLPNGQMGRFKFVESPVWGEGFEISHPELRTYLGQGIDDPYASVRFDYTPEGFHAMIISPFGTVFIDPYSQNETDYYMSYYKHDYRRTTENDFKCLTESHDNIPTNYYVNRTGEQLRTYRLAVSCTGEFTINRGGVQGALNNITTTINRINQVYEVDFAVRLSVIPNCSLVVFEDPNTDPFTNNNGGALLGQNQTTLDNIIGDANYDIGHVFSTGNFGGIAGLSVVCISGAKGRGATGSTNPIGDPWAIDYVAHEMGHQFGGNHTQNNTNCNANPGTAWEPASGITIMGYAGVCPPNLANNSIAYIHGGNIFVEMIPFTQAGSGSTCGTLSSTGNNPPVVTVPTGGFTIPKSTPFSLTGTATDPDNDPLTYSWEQTNTGPQGHPNNPVGNAPIFRPFAPVTNGTRYFPKLSDVINNTQSLGEIMATYSRLMRFRLTVRDNRAGGGGIASDEVIFTVEETAGPFLVTFPNTNVAISGNQTITWDVANTNAAPVSCANVRILLSTDGGNTFPTVLAQTEVNDGSALVTLPNISTTTARVKVEAIDNVFYDMSNANFEINPIGIINNNTGIPVEFGLMQNFPNPFNPTTVVTYAIPKKSAVTLKVYDAVGRYITTLVNNELKTEGYYNVEFDASSLASGIYYYQLTAGDFTDTKKMIMVK